MSIILFLLICLCIGAPIYIIYITDRKNKIKQHNLIKNTFARDTNNISANRTVNNENEDEKGLIIDEPILKSNQPNKIPTSPCVDGLVGIGISSVKRQNDKFQYLTIYIYIQNLSNGYIAVNLETAYFITHLGEQIKGSLRHIVVEDTYNEVIIPYLKVQAPIYFYDQIKEVYDNDIIVIQLSVNKELYALSVNIGNTINQIQKY